MSLFPEDYIDSIYQVDFEALYSQGYRAVLFDVDNTLVPHNAPADEKAKKFFSYLRNTGFKTLMISNNSEPRVKLFCEAVNGDGYIYKAKKPSTSGYKKAMELLETTADTTLFAGDQIFTDIWGANRSGIRSIMVKPVLKWKEEPQIVLKRFLEAIIMVFYRLKVSAFGVKNKVPTKEDL